MYVIYLKVVLISQSCLTLCDPTDYSPPGFSDHEFPGQEYWSVLPFPSPGDLPNPGIKSEYPALQADSLPSEPPGKPNYIYVCVCVCVYICVCLCMNICICVYIYVVVIVQLLSCV